MEEQLCVFVVERSQVTCYSRGIPKKPVPQIILETAKACIKLTYLLHFHVCLLFTSLYICKCDFFLRTKIGCLQPVRGKRWPHCDWLLNEEAFDRAFQKYSIFWWADNILALKFYRNDWQDEKRIFIYN